jgi:hypothetical protein
MPAQLITEALDAWREAERALQRLPQGSPDHETVRLIVVQMKAVYADLAQAKVLSKARLERSREAIAMARASLRNERAQ